MPLAPKPENFIPGDLSCSPSDLSRSPGHVLRLGVLPLGISCITYEKTTHDALLQVYLFFVPLHRLDLYFGEIAKPFSFFLLSACPAKLKSNKVKDDPLLAADIDELRKTQNQNVTADVMDITEFEE
ncbi:uncharacterized protein LOC126597179 isoform X1 [Malus sylvestris]|uniref:uncharacterized protein LOC126597179 isoform X1 n=1 Tax=Malus sylvestris TaxID=3752 RepID=UPI0021AC3D59|nr:uncharacterized protein LOC126597179 isoform X1 [Malus sylvestris]